MFKKVEKKEELQDTFQLRTKVFCDEQGFDREIEIDHHDHSPNCWHYLALSPHCVGTARLVINGDQGKLGRLAVQKEFRSKGLGKKLVSYIEEDAKKNDIKTIILHSQLQALPFYEKLGYHAVDKTTFYEDGQLHVKVRKLI